ncbi:uncharacterized protein LOC6605705 isoform X2 [Drosophila sechellia]|uniref:uncharacterized protein LOC6605705 isoform X2 n=1 Tax=Drosophila sechellia TaxID=7238 RepID=UPI0013DE3724|nr:uncharacterized protein LOC6605705 isoform X2 [Drosophila sechellia]
MNESTPSDCSTPKTQIPIKGILRQTRESVTEIFTKYRQKVGNGAFQAAQRVRTSQQLSLIKPTLRCETKRQRIWLRRGGHCVPFGGHSVDALVWTLPGQELQSRLYLWKWRMPFDVFVDIR